MGLLSESLSKAFLTLKISLVIVLLVLTSCGNKESESAEALDISANPHTDELVITRAQFEAAQMQVGTIETKAFARQINANGYIDVPPDQKASVSVKLGGFVKSVTILPGDRITKGKVLFTLENPEFIQLQQEYLENHAQLKYLQSDYERQKALADENIASQKNFLKAESDYKVVQARVQGLEEKLKMLNVNIKSLEAGTIASVVHVYAPISGYVSKVNISLGVSVSPDDVAVELVDTDHMHAELQVFEKDVVDIRKGQKFSFRTSGSDTWYDGEVYLVGKTIESSTRTVSIHGHIHDEKNVPNLLPGMYLEATIEVASVERSVLPTEAVVSVDDAKYVLMLLEETPDEFRFKRLEVTAGQFNNQWTEIVNTPAKQPDAKFLIKGAFNLVVE
ncbi:MAG: efflux RND transporter periplasmic adaptor subunit [Cyclobacteriaceae bacterium]|nr:efflux RND transporter periplasmic adaptor subunit [Cyclobacteriaceae bacterium]